MKLVSPLKTNYRHGVEAEAQAARHLQTNGYTIIATRYKTKFGEIDLIAASKSTLIFVEVKRRKYRIEDDPIPPKQKKRIINTALQFLAEQPKFGELDMRFDVIFVDKNFTLSHIEDSWRIEEI